MIKTEKEERSEVIFDGMLFRHEREQRFIELYQAYLNANNEIDKVHIAVLLALDWSYSSSKSILIRDIEELDLIAYDEDDYTVNNCCPVCDTHFIYQENMKYDVCHICGKKEEKDR